MTQQSGAVYDLGYEPYEGERTGRNGARKAVYIDGIRRVLGLGRKARRKVMPWTLLFFAVVPAVVAIGIGFLVPAGTPDAINLADQNSEFFTVSGTIAMLFTALAAPELLIPDRKDGVLSMLSSRPLTPIDYLGARFASLATVVASFMILPQLLLFFGQAGTDPEGLIQGLINAAPTLPKIVAVTAVYTIAFIPLGFVIASLSNRKAIATASYVAMMIALTAFAEAIVRESSISGGRWVALLAPINTADAANVWIFGGSNPDSLLAAADISPVYGIIALIVFGTLLTLFSVNRYRRLM
jgi:ABC-2 type transport system permease protein